MYQVGKWFGIHDQLYNDIYAPIARHFQKSANVTARVLMPFLLFAYAYYLLLPRPPMKDEKRKKSSMAGIRVRN